MATADNMKLIVSDDEDSDQEVGFVKACDVKPERVDKIERAVGAFSRNACAYSLHHSTYRRRKLGWLHWENGSISIAYDPPHETIFKMTSFVSFSTLRNQERKRNTRRNLKLFYLAWILTMSLLGMKSYW